MGRERRKWEHTLPRFPFHCYTNPQSYSAITPAIAEYGAFSTPHKVAHLLLYGRSASRKRVH